MIDWAGLGDVLLSYCHLVVMNRSHTGAASDLRGNLITGESCLHTIRSRELLYTTNTTRKIPPESINDNGPNTLSL